jgi:hypothetical protein
MPARRNQRNHRLRQEIAVEAARVIATEGQRSYLVAKQKAAERLGASTRNGLPSNSEVEEALRQWQQIYGGQAHEHQLLNLRQSAASAMRFLSRFRPRLVGPVAEGTADQYSRICLQVFADNPDDIVHFLMEHHVRFQQERRRVRWHDGDYRHIDVLVIDNNDGIVELAMMIGRDALQALPSPIDGKPQQRMTLGEIEELISPAANQ